MCGGVRDGSVGRHKNKFYFGAIFIMLLLLFPSVIKAQKNKVTWEPREESNITKYKIYRSVETNSNFVSIGTVNHPGSSYNDANINYNTHYYYAVTSIDALNNESDLSAYSDVITPSIYNLSIGKNPTAGGTVTKSPDKTSYIQGEQVTLTVTANAGYQFANWGGDANGTSLSITITMNANKSVTANFTANQYTLTLTTNPTASGSIIKSPNKLSYTYGEQVTLTAAANSGYSFANWSGDASGTSLSVSVTMNANKNVVANFLAAQYTLNILIDPEDAGTVSKTPDKPFYSAGETVRLKATASSRYRFDYWSGDFADSQSSVTITMDRAKEITAHFRPKFQIAGNVKYRDKEIPLSNTLVELSGDSTAALNADESGFYEFSSLDAEAQYITTASRNRGFDNSCILSYDAAIAARIAMNLVPDATMGARIAADVDRNNSVQMFDAALIAQYAVGLANYSCHIGGWGFSPSTRYYDSLDSNLINQDFNGTIIGDVDGNWVPDGPFAKTNNAKKVYSYLTDAETNIGEEFVIPFIAEGEREVLSFDAGLNYDCKALKYKGFNRTDLCQNFQIFVNDTQEGHLRIGGFGMEAITADGTYLELIFEIIGNNASSSQVELYSYRINAEEEQQAIATVVIAADEHFELPREYVLTNNYPNPFNPQTSINFQVPEPGLVTITIFNMLGQQIRTLINEEKSPGHYFVNWNGLDDHGLMTPTGTYIYRMQANGFSAAKKMSLTK